MADQVDGCQILIILPQEAVQSRNLAGSSGEKDLSALLQMVLSFLVAMPDAALNILGALQLRQVLQRFNCNMVGIRMTIFKSQSCSKDNTALPQKL